eukprot:CAMPEP_0181325740 /NCGR_PEP_ID=MMETSP1101-20121128/21102_1 /TAXON_ID=46948 /ORGANISM="Rhodomonas abbreviata, Strain Caron Lab Isolate" /LENGTH=209 /DNA_ID=CAMNT_0023434099 /DNA_START=249 /DNA_END=876 /DNA_ORIENTATION=-
MSSVSSTQSSKSSSSSPSIPSSSCNQLPIEQEGESSVGRDMQGHNEGCEMADFEDPGFIHDHKHRSIPTFSHACRSNVYKNCVKVKGPSSEEIGSKLKNNSILYVLGISPTTFVEAYKAVEQLTTKQFQLLVKSNIKRANTTFRIHSLDRTLSGYLTADLPVEPNMPGKYRLIFKHRNNNVKCIGLIDDHCNALPLPTGHEIHINDKTW